MSRKSKRILFLLITYTNKSDTPKDGFVVVVLIVFYVFGGKGSPISDLSFGWIVHGEEGSRCRRTVNCPKRFFVFEYSCFSYSFSDGLGRDLRRTPHCSAVFDTRSPGDHHGGVTTHTDCPMCEWRGLESQRLPVVVVGPRPRAHDFCPLGALENGGRDVGSHRNEGSMGVIMVFLM